MMRTTLLHVLCLPADLLGLAVAAIVSFGARWARVPHDRFVVAVHLPNGWLTKRWRYSVTLSHVLLMHPEHGPKTLRHELAHVEQFEDACCALWLALLATYALPWWALPALAWSIVCVGAWIASWLRGGRAYYDSTLERHARAEAGQ